MAAISAEIVVVSNDDLLTEIFLRLPMKSLRRFKLVSKHWLSLITNPQLWCRRNLRKPNPAVGMLLFRPTRRGDFSFKYVPFHRELHTIPPSRTLDFTKEPVDMTVEQSCNGLLLCSSYPSREDYEKPHFYYNVDKEQKHYVYNPTTNQFTTLPELDGEKLGFYKCIQDMRLVFDDNHYRVVCVYNEFSRQDLSLASNFEHHIQVYFPETGVWRKSGAPYTPRFYFADGVYWNGAVHWISYGVKESLYFNIRRQVLEKMPNPPMAREVKESGYYFGESCNHLHFVEYCLSEIQFYVYELKRDYSEWFVLYRVDLSEVASAYPEMSFTNSRGLACRKFSVVSVVRGKTEDQSFLVLRVPGKVIRYDLKSNNFWELLGFAGADDYNNVLDTYGFGFMYIKSLSCV